MTVSIHDQAQALMDRMVVAYRAADAAGCAALFTTDAIVTSPYAPTAHGRDAIEALHRDWTSGGTNSKRITVINSGGAGDVAWCVSAFSEGDVTEDGTSLSVLVHDSEAGWLIRACSLNSDFPAPDAQR